MPTPQDLINADRNLGTLDEIINSDNESVVTRTGKRILTIEGATKSIRASESTVASAANSALDAIRDSESTVGSAAGGALGAISAAENSVQQELQDAIARTGYNFIGEFTDGATLESRVDALRFDGEWYRWDGALPKVVPAGSDPESEGGIGSGAWLSVGDAALRSDLANPGKGAAMVARGVVAVDSIADLLALPEGRMRGDLRYLVKGYHAGSDVGGGDFYYDHNRADENDGGIVLDGFVRVLDGDVNVNMFGAVGDGVTDCSPAFNAAFNCGAGVVVIPQAPAEYVLNGNTSVDTPVRIVGKGGVIKLHGRDIDGNNGLPFENDGWLLRATVSDVSFENLIIDGNSRNNYVTDSGGATLYYSEPDIDAEIGTKRTMLIRVSVYPNNADIDNIKVLGCRFIDAPGPSVLFNGDTSTVADTAPKIRNVLVSGCTFVHGQRAVVSTFGVRGAVIQNNTFVNPYWNTIQFYLDTKYGTADGNTITLNLSEVDYAKTSSGRIMGGISVGHKTRGAGSVHYTKVINNKIKLPTKAEADAEGLEVDTQIRVSENTTNTIVIGNTVDGCAHNIEIRSGAKDVNVENNELSNAYESSIYIEGGVTISEWVDRVLLSGNRIKSSGNIPVFVLRARNVAFDRNQIDGSPGQNASVFISQSDRCSIRNNLIDSYATCINAASSRNIEISENKIVGFGADVKGIVLQTSAENPKIQGNSIQGFDRGIDVSNAVSGIVSSNIVADMAGVGLYFFNCAGLSVASNVIKDTGLVGLYVFGSTGVVCVSNRIERNSLTGGAQPAIRVTSACDRVSLLANHVIAYSLYSVIISADSDNTYVHGNVLYGWETAAINDGSASSKIGQNL